MAAVSALASCGGDDTLTFGPSPITEPATTAATGIETTEPPATDRTDMATTAESRSTAEVASSAVAGSSSSSSSTSAPTVVSGAAASTSVPSTTVARPSTTVARSTTTVAPTTTVPFTSPVGSTTSTAPTGPVGPPAVFVDVAAAGGLDDVGAGTAPPIEQVATQLAPGALVLPAGARVLDVEIRVIPSADPEQSGASARQDRIRAVISTELGLDALSARFRDALVALGDYQPAEAALAEPQRGVTITAPAPPTDPAAPTWTIALIADEARPGRWVVETQRQHPAFPAPPTQIPTIVAGPLGPATALLDALEWAVDGWDYRFVVDDATGNALTTRRATFVSGVTDIAEVSAALMMSLPGAQRTDFEGAVEILGADGMRWRVGGVNASGLVRGSVELDG